MKLKIKVNSLVRDTEYGGEQTIQIKEGEFVLDEIFRLSFFRIIVDLVVDGSVGFRLMEGAEPNFFVLDGVGDNACYERETSIGFDSFYFELVN